MSNYSKITKHPQTGYYEIAEYRDDFFGPHIYGVYFKSDDKTYPSDLVERKQVYDFWVDDVLNAYKDFLTTVSLSDDGIDHTEELVMEFLNNIQNQYVERWKKDPAAGNGATLKSAVLKRDLEDILDDHCI
jgi:hypothetical protein